MLNFKNITLLIIDCNNLDRARHAIDMCTKVADFGAVKHLTHFDNTDPITVHIPKLDYAGYNDLVVNKMYKYFDTEYVMLIHWDGYILHPDLWRDEFLAYDYIGAPVIWPEIGTHSTGNGGFSIRSRKLQKYLYEHQKPLITLYEDREVCCVRKAELDANGFTFAPVSVSKDFAVDLDGGPGLPDRDITKTFGFHSPIVLEQIRQLEYGK